eukprot:CAMPEP_0119154188 /NCGR_PEP_ID=MMETSP1310-20130426/50439_1 /TAXON_ID=464262 /ORGANISM="Genus nov. species nov., Strain RCC2339" /LENGTH=284 /DNA_ID=CAMNT_0007146707 /DNA_START=18 /DNA_END=869 /DNA_ORIENTATION=-
MKKKRCKCNPSEKGRDPITAEKLRRPHPQHPFFVSPDGSLTICYNESTLRRVAETKGKWLHPPSFREPMSDEMVKKCESIGGPLSIPPRKGNTDVDEFEVRHVEGIDEMLENLAGSVSQTQLNLCPRCYSRLVQDLFEETNNEYPDPMDVVLSRGRASVKLFAFRNKRDWSRHLRGYHHVRNVEDWSMEDYRLKQLIYQWLESGCRAAEYYKGRNYRVQGWDDEKQEIVWKVAIDGQSSITAYWHAHAHYRVGQYNDLVNIVLEGGEEGCLFSASDGEEDSDAW